jgi:hypothetical protein
VDAEKAAVLQEMHTDNLDDCDETLDDDYDGIDESMDGDFDSAMASAGYGTDEDYGSSYDDGQYDDYFDQYE